MEYLLGHSNETDGPRANWCSNEKTAYEAAVGCSMVGQRALVTMKHVGLNVAADPFMNSPLMDIQGGLVLAVADDPGQHSSQNEQDSRFYADFAKIICLEPRNQQEAYEMTKEAFELSERFRIPVMLKLVTRLSHSRAVVTRGKKREENKMQKFKNKTGWITLPGISRKAWAHILEQQEEFLEYTEGSEYNPLVINGDLKEYGVVTTGLARNYYEENLEELAVKPSHLHISAYPIPEEKVKKLAEAVDRVVVIEEGYPLVERLLRGILPGEKVINGKMDAVVPPTGELDPDNIRPALGLAASEGLSMMAGNLPGRPPQLCKGCPHEDSFNALNDVLADFNESIVTSDIGCYTLGYLPPYNAIETALCMGASITMARGAADAGFHPVVAVIGDSTFMHSGLTGLVDAVSRNVNMTVMILDNSTTAMTGGQDTIVSSSGLKQAVLGLGVDPDHVKEFIPLSKNRKENVEIIRKEIDYNGISVIIPIRECIQTLKKKKGTKKEVNK
jgi:indolepyruvate ferredoxin oxidoreductase alpha subunit